MNPSSMLGVNVIVVCDSSFAEETTKISMRKNGTTYLFIDGRSSPYIKRLPLPRDVIQLDNYSL